jgi:hypothetical protein
MPTQEPQRRLQHQGPTSDEVGMPTQDPQRRLQHKEPTSHEVGISPTKSWGVTRVPQSFSRVCALCLSSRLPVRSFEFLHERDQRLDAIFRKRIVNRSSNAADRTMTFESIKPSFRSFADKLFFQVFVR